MARSDAVRANGISPNTTSEELLPIDMLASPDTMTSPDMEPLDQLISADTENTPLSGHDDDHL